MAYYAAYSRHHQHAHKIILFKAYCVVPSFSIRREILLLKDGKTSKGPVMVKPSKGQHLAAP